MIEPTPERDRKKYKKEENKTCLCLYVHLRGHDLKKVLGRVGYMVRLKVVASAEEGRWYVS